MTINEKYEIKKQLVADLREAMKRVNQIHEDISRVDNGLYPKVRDDDWVPPFLRKAELCEP